MGGKYWMLINSDNPEMYKWSVTVKDRGAKVFSLLEPN